MQSLRFGIIDIAILMTLINTSRPARMSVGPRCCRRLRLRSRSGIRVGSSIRMSVGVSISLRLGI